MDTSNEDVAQLPARSNEFRHLPEPTWCARDEGYLSQELEWMQMEEHQLESVATSSGIVGTDDTTLIERVELSSCGVACDRLLVHLNKSNYCMSGDIQTAPKSF